MPRIPVHQISLPEYNEKEKPDHDKIGEKLGDFIKKHFMGQKIAIRTLGFMEHKGKSLENLIKIIKKLGTDRYDPKRKGDRYENVQNKKIDFFAWDHKITPNFILLHLFVKEFYNWAKKR